MPLGACTLIYTHAFSLLKVMVIFALSAEHPRDDGNSNGGYQSRETRRRITGEPGGGADLSATMEGPERFCSAERHRPTGFSATGKSA